MAAPVPPTEPTTNSDLIGLAKDVGELRASMRELIHDQINESTSRKIAAEILIELKTVPDKLDKIDLRLKTLEDDKIRRDQTNNLGAMVLKSPMFAWLVTGVAFLWGLLTGRIDFHG